MHGYSEYGLPDYSDLRLVTGFVVAAFIAWITIVTMAIISAMAPAIPNTHQPI